MIIASLPFSFPFFPVFIIQIAAFFPATHSSSSSSSSSSTPKIWQPVLLEEGGLKKKEGQTRLSL